MSYRFIVIVFSFCAFAIAHASSLTADYGRHLAQVVDDTVKSIHATESKSFITHADILALMCVEQRSLRIGNNSPVGARGLTQVMPNTFKDYYRRNRHGFRDFVNRTNCSIQALSQDPRCSIEAGARIFDDLLVRYDGDRNKAAGAYHGGPGAVISKTKYKGPKTTKYANEWFPSCFRKVVNNKTPEPNEVWSALVSATAELTDGTFGTQGVSAQLVQYKAGSDSFFFDSVKQNPVATNPMFGSLISTSYSPDVPGVVPVQVNSYQNYNPQEDYFVLNALYSENSEHDLQNDSMNSDDKKDNDTIKSSTVDKHKNNNKSDLVEQYYYNYDNSTFGTVQAENDKYQPSFFDRFWSSFWGWAGRETDSRTDKAQNNLFANNSQMDNSQQIRYADDFFESAQVGSQERYYDISHNSNNKDNFNTPDGFLYCLPKQVLSGEPFLLAYSCPKNYKFDSSNFGASSDSGVKSYSLTSGKEILYSCKSETKTINYKCEISVLDPQINSFNIVGREGAVVQLAWESKDMISCKLSTDSMKVLREGVFGEAFVDTNKIQTNKLYLICDTKTGVQIKKSISI